MPLHVDIVTIPAPDGGFWTVELGVDTLQFVSDVETYLVKPIPMITSKRIVFFEQLVNGKIRQYMIFRVASVVSGGVELTEELDVKAVAYSPDSMSFVLLADVNNSIDGYRKLGRHQSIAIKEASLV